MSLISVIIPAHNCSSTIIDTITSVLKARKKNRVEIIVVDDCSTDDTVAVVAEKFDRLRNDKRPLKLIKSWKNTGAGAARNKGLKHATGDYVLFVDADDTLEEGAIDELTRVANATSADFVTFRYHYVTELGTPHEAGMLSGDQALWSSLLPECKDGVLDPRQHSRISRLTNYPWNKLIRTDFAKSIDLKFSQTPVNNDIAAHWALYTSARRVAMHDSALIYHYVVKGNNQITNLFDHRRLSVFSALAEAEAHVLRSAETINPFYHHFMHFKVDLLKWIYKRLEPSHREQFIARLAESYREYGKSEHVFLSYKAPNTAEQCFRVKHAPMSIFC